MIDRSRIEEALEFMAAQRGRFGDAAVDTAVAVLEERLAALPRPAVEQSPVARSPQIQRKQVTILFAALNGFTHLAATKRNTERLRQIDLLWRRLDGTIHAHGGIVDKHMGDVIMGIFGAEVSREDDAERAVRCALALRETADDYLNALERDDLATEGAPTIRIGINTGQVILGQVGSDTGRTAIGDAVNVASRLKEAAAEADIYISQDTYRLVRNSFRVEPLGDVTVRGREMPVPAYRVMGSRPRVFFPGLEDAGEFRSPMIGRDKEMSVLQAALSRTMTEGRGRLVLITGDVGVGKSRLAGEFYRGLEPSVGEASIFVARSDERMAQIPYGLLRDLIITHFNIDEGDEAAAIEERIVKRLAESRAGQNPFDESEARNQARAITRLVGLYPSGDHQPEPGGDDGAAVRDQAIAAFLNYLEALPRSPLTLFLLEDIHWIDEDSLDLLERVCAAATDQALLMIGLARPTFLERWPHWPARSNIPTTRLTLQPLNEFQSREMVHTLLRRLPQVPPELAQLIVHSSAGNPFYAEELIQVLIEDGIIVVHDQGWLLRPRQLTRLRVPATLTGVLQARIDRLPDVERVTLQQAAVIGDEFWAGAVQAINTASRYPYSAEQTEAALQSLERRDIIYRPPASVFGGTQAYRFTHAVLREVAYESVLLRDRPGYHLETAQWLEAQSGERPADFAALIAQHHELGGRVAEAAHLYETAATRSLEQFKLTNAIQQFRKVIDLLRDRPQDIDTRLAAMERLGDAQRRRGRLVEALETYRLMHDTAELDGNIQLRARARNARSLTLLRLGRHDEAFEAAREAERLARLTDAAIELIRSLLLQAESAGRLGRAHEAMAAAVSAVGRGRKLDAPIETAAGLAMIIRLPSAMAQPQASLEAMAELEALVEAATNDGQERRAAFMLRLIGDTLLAQGRAADAAGYYDRGLGLAQRVNDLGLSAELLRQSGLALCRMGNAPEAISRIEEAAGLAEVTGDRYMRLRCRLAMGEALAAQGHVAAAEATLRQAIAAAENRQRMGGWEELPHAYRLLAELAK